MSQRLGRAVPICRLGAMRPGCRALVGRGTGAVAHRCEEAAEPVPVRLDRLDDAGGTAPALLGRGEHDRATVVCHLVPSALHEPLVTQLVEDVGHAGAADAQGGTEVDGTDSLT